MEEVYVWFYKKPLDLFPEWLYHFIHLPTMYECSR